MVNSGAADSGSWREQLRDIAGWFDQPAVILRQLIRDVIARALVAVGAENGSVLIPDGDGRHLRFFVSAGPTTEKVADLKVPLEGSIAGYVFSTGQMTSVGDLAGENHPQFYQEIDKKSGIATRAYLALPILLGGRALGVATYVNRPGNPPYRPFQQEEMVRAQAFAGVEAVLLRFWDRTGHLARVAAQDWTAALKEMDPGAPLFPAQPFDTGHQAEPWVRVLGDLEALAEEDQAFCAEFVSLLKRWRRGGGP